MCTSRTWLPRRRACLDSPSAANHSAGPAAAAKLSKQRLGESVTEPSPEQSLRAQRLLHGDGNRRRAMYEETALRHSPLGRFLQKHNPSSAETVPRIWLSIMGGGRTTKTSPEQPDLNSYMSRRALQYQVRVVWKRSQAAERFKSILSVVR